MTQNLEALPAFCKAGVHVIIETPKGSQNKFDYDPHHGLFRLKKTLPMGTVFPFDFGFIPNTEGEDGDPLDVLVLMDQHGFPGCLIDCRVIGVLTAEQKEKGKKTVRNDRFVAVAACSVMYRDITNIKSLNKSMIQEIENFFIDYNKHEGRQFSPEKWQDDKKALEMVKKSLKS